MRRAASFLLVLAIVGGCAEQDPATNKAQHVHLPDGFTPVGGEPFTIELSPGRGPAWILTQGGKWLYVLYDREQSSPPHYFRYEGTLSREAVALSAPTETLVWPDGLGSGEYRLCNAGLEDQDDWCVTIVVE